MLEVKTFSRPKNGSSRTPVHRALLLQATKLIDFVFFQSHFLLFSVVFLIGAKVLLPLMLYNQCYHKNSMLFASLLKHTTKIFGVSWELRDGAILRQEREGVIVANHQSTLDFVGMANAWQEIGKCTATLKKEIWYLWPLGLTGRLMGVCFLDRSNPKVAWKALEESTARSFQNETKLWIFPEGTRNRQGKTLLPFKKGAFKMAIAFQVPVLPVIFSPYYFVDEKNSKLHRGGKTVVKALPPISTLGLTMNDLDALTARTRHVMQNAFDELSDEVRLTSLAQNS